MTDRIEKIVELKAPISRVWQALTDHEQFGRWFRVKLDGPFKPGTVSTGKMTYPGVEDMPWRAIVEQMFPETLFSFRWHDFDEKSGLHISQQPMTLVEFRLEAIPGGTRLTITESGFESIYHPRRLDVMRGNEKGWEIQSGSLAAYVSG